MRIAAIQLRIDPTSRTVTLQRALAAIDEAAETDPAPDLIVLPAFCDVFDIATGGSALGERVPGQAMAACGLRARSWGLFIAFGLAERGADRPFVSGILLDRDGDVRLTQRQVSLNKAQASVFAAGGGFAAAEILLGRFALLVGDDVLDAAAWDAAAGAGVQCVIATTCSRHGKGACATVAEHAARCGLPCAMADVTMSGAKAGGPYAGHSLIVDESGKTLASAKPDAAAILRANVTLPDAKPVQIDGAL